ALWALDSRPRPGDEEIAASRSRASRSGFFGDHDRPHAVERDGRRDLRPRAPGGVDPEDRSTDRGCSGPYKPQLIGTLPRQRGETTYGKMPASVHGDEDARTGVRRARTVEDDHSSGAARQRLDFRPWRWPRGAAGEFTLERHVPDDETSEKRRNRWPSRDSKPLRKR